MATVKLEAVKKIYKSAVKDVVAVQEFNLEIADKEFVVFVGPSGCGKSTTLRMIAGLEDITEGIVSIDDKVVNYVEPKDRDIAMVFQNYALYPHMTVYENMAFGLKLRKNDIKKDIYNKLYLEQHGTESEGKDTDKALMSQAGKMVKEYIHQHVLNAATILDITDYLPKRPKEMSGGQRQRVAIGRAIVREPKVFLMDEPLSNLDAKLRNQMRSEILQLRTKVDTTFIYVTHDQTEAMTLGDRIVIMKDGFIQQVGTPQEVFDKPNNLFVAGFIGAPQMNMFDATIEGGKINMQGKSLPLPAEAKKILKEKGYSGGSAVVGVRPEHMAISLEPTENSFESKLFVTEMMGSELQLHLDLPTGEQIIVRVPTFDLDSSVRGKLVQGATVHFSILHEALHLFDKQTEFNLLYGVDLYPDRDDV